APRTKLQQLTDELGEPVDLAQHQVDVFARRRMRADFRSKELHGTADAAERVADLVREAGNQRAELGEVFRATDVGVEVPLHGEVLKNQRGAGATRIAIENSRSRSADGNLLVPEPADRANGGDATTVASPRFLDEVDQPWGLREDLRMATPTRRPDR